jgi:hypothetical protein
MGSALVHRNQQHRAIPHHLRQRSPTSDNVDETKGVPMQRWFLIIVSILVGSALGGGSRVDADAPRGRTAYASFCCQSGPNPGGAGVTATFTMCYETEDSARGRNCPRDAFYYYPISVRTDRNFAFNNESGDLTILAD